MRASVPTPPCVSGQVYFNTGAAAGKTVPVCQQRVDANQRRRAGDDGTKAGWLRAGQMYFATDATAGSNLYFCTGSNTWTQMAGCSTCVTDRDRARTQCAAVERDVW